ncbi:myosin-M heavy chain-like isoform X3 [Plodia interpunctella]|uniref:myosin-M heavy chain-like isoform X3 n=1 Tax=Plodia interpunctella TaxID=58824 RepID=UPI002368D6C6|nr:myosin-M heavy chain-like isoform X3 [Plodia interpunctella]
MIYQILFLCLLFFVDARSVEKVSERNVTKRAANTEFFPDWVPFKNKNGDELGEFVQVETKKKPKKRLAQPMNFKLKQLEPQGDYDDFGGGGGDINEGEDYEKKEWSDLYRSGIRIKPQNLSHTDLSDIDGLVNIITNSNPIREHRPLLVRTTKKPTTVIDDDDYLDQSKETDSQKRENREKYEQELTTNKKVQESANKTSDEDYNYEDDKKQKEKQEQMETERKESEARKALILNAVDELKARHEVEQRILSEKEKEEEIFKEEHERDRVDTDEGRDKYDRRKPKFRNFYDLYDDHFGQSTSYDKYDIIIEKTTPEPTTTVSTPRKSKKNKKRKNKKKKPVETPGQILVYNNPEKISVFKNPEAFMYKDDEESTTSTTKKPKLVPKRTTAHPKTRKTGKFSSKISMTPNSIVTSPKNREGSVRISLVPQASGSEESPALFFPQPNNRKKKRGKNTTANTDSYVDETVADITTNNYTTFDESVTNQTEIDATASDTKSIDVTSPPVKDAVVTNSDTVPDVVAAPTEKKQTNEGNYVHKKGGDREYTSSHEEVHRETGKKAYEPAIKKNRDLVQLPKPETKLSDPWYILIYFGGNQENMKKQSKVKGTTIKKTIPENTLTKQGLTRNTTTNQTNMERITMRNTAKSTQSTRNLGSTQRATAQKAATTYIRKKNTRNESNSSRKMVTRQRKRNMVASTTNGNIHRVGTSRKPTWKLVTTPATRAMRGTTRREAMLTVTRATNHQRATTVTDATTTPISANLGCIQEISGATATPRQQRSQMLLQLIAELTNSMLARNITDELTQSEEQF